MKRIVNFGAFVEIVPGKEGLVHVSEMSPEYVQDPHDVVEIGQKVKVNVKEVDEHGRINLSMLFGERPERPEGGQGGDRGDRGDRGPREDRQDRGGRDDRGGRRDFRGGDRGGRDDRGGRRGFSPRGGRGPKRAPFDNMRPGGDDRNRR